MLNSYIRYAFITVAVTVGCGSDQLTGKPLTGGAPPDGGGACLQAPGVRNLLQSPLSRYQAFENIASDGQYVYFTGYASLYRVPVAGGAAETLVADQPIERFGVGGGTVAWLTNTQPVQLIVQNAAGVQSVSLPAGLFLAYQPILVDSAGNVFFVLSLADGSSPQTWQWSAETSSASEMLGVGTAYVPASLYGVDRGQIIWSNGGGTASGVYATDIATGGARQLLDPPTFDFGAVIGLDAANVYAEAQLCGPMCPLAINGVPRGGGASFVAYQSVSTYRVTWLQADDSGFTWMDNATNSVFHATQMGAAEIRRVNLTGSHAIPTEFALDAQNIYWIDDGWPDGPCVLAVAK
jgi:hypothetical protein